MTWPSVQESQAVYCVPFVLAQGAYCHKVSSATIRRVDYVVHAHSLCATIELMVSLNAALTVAVHEALLEIGFCSRKRVRALFCSDIL